MNPASRSAMANMPSAPNPISVACNDFIAPPRPNNGTFISFYQSFISISGLIGVRSLCFALGRLASQSRKHAASDERENEKRDYPSEDFDEMGLQPTQDLFNFIAEEKGQPC